MLEKEICSGLGLPKKIFQWVAINCHKLCALPGTFFGRISGTLHFYWCVHIGTILTFLVQMYISESLFSVFWLNSHEKCQFSLHEQWTMSLICLWWVKSCIIVCCEVQCWQIWIFYPAYALDFTNCRFGSLSRLGPYSLWDWVPIS